MDIDGYRTRFTGRTAGLLRRVVINLSSRVIADTPVDTGLLQGNWQATQEPLDGPIDRLTDPTDEVTEQIRDLMGSEDCTLYLNNAVEYGPEIEYGGKSTIKAPEGMLRINVVRIEDIIKEELAKNP